MKNFRTLFILRLLPVILISLIGFGSVEAQETGSCAEKLKSAQTAFARGQTEVIPSLLTDCLTTGGFKREEEIAAYKLLIQTCLLNDKLEEADSAMLAFLKRNPEYKTSPTDHSSFVYLYNSYDVKSLLSLSFRIGPNMPFLTFVEENPTAGDTANSKYRSDARNLFLSFDAKYRISARIELGLGIGLSQMKFTNNLDYYNFGHITYQESQMRLDIPVFMTYDLTGSQNLIPYLRAGAGVSLNLATSANAVFKNDPGSKQGDKTGKTLDRMDSRAGIDLFAQAGAGIKYKIPRGFLFAEARTSMGIMQQYVTGGDVDELNHKYYWADPGFRLNSVNLNFGITIIFYKPEKKEAAK